MQVEVHAPEELTREQVRTARALLASVDREGDPGLTKGRLALRRSRGPAAPHPFIADASVLLDGRLLAAHVTGDSALAAAAEAAAELRRQLRRIRGDAKIVVPGKWASWAREARRGWRWDQEALVRELRFPDFDEGLRFLTQVGRHADDYKRRPAMSIAGNRVRLTIANPHNAGITLAELRLAAKVNAVIDSSPAAAPGPGA